MEEVDEIVQEFLVESYDSLDRLDADFVALEENPDDRERLANIFRTVHTVKGTSGFLDFPKLEKVAHVGENLLVPLRDGQILLNNEIVDSLLGMVDAIRQILGNVETTGGEGGGDYTALIEKLERAKCQTTEEGLEPDSVAETKNSELPEEHASVIEGDAHLDDDVPVEIESNTSEADRSRQEENHANSNATPEKVTQETAEIAKPVNSIADSTIRVNVEILDQLMNLVGELVLTRNQILQHSQDSADTAVTAASQRLNLITSELQEGVMKTRMQPIRNAWSKLPRVVRDLSMSCGKQVKVEMEGADTELDKTILEAIKDPLTHIVRNSVDHGIEDVATREAIGKPATGTLLLRSFHEGGQVNIEIIDDGGGINIQRVKDKAIEKGLITQEKSEMMSERELTNLVLLPGFSTAQKVTNVSGRGVGMDVVRTNIEKIGGSLELHSVSGKGTTLRIKIPLTLAIVPALIIKSAAQRFAIPQVSLLELVRLEAERADQKIEMIHNVPVYRLRGNLLPLIYLDEQLQLENASTRTLALESNVPSEVVSDTLPADQETSEADPIPDSINIVVLQAEDRQFGLVVDQINDTQEIVVKPLGKQLSSVQTFAGATIMGDGNVALILDVAGIAQHAGILTEHLENAFGEDNDGSKQETSEFTPMLIVDRGDGIRVAIELATVARLEEFPFSSIERTDSGAVVQYRGGILRLVSMVADINLQPEEHKESMQDLPEPDSAEQKQIQVIVFSDNGTSVGVVVGEIIDVVEHSVDCQVSSQRPDSETDLLVIQERVTKVVDLAAMVAAPPTISGAGKPNLMASMLN